MVRPVDLQDNLSKAPLASRLQQVQQVSPDIAQRQLSEGLKQQHLSAQRRPSPAEPGDQVELHFDENGSQGQQEAEEDNRQSRGQKGSETDEGKAETSHDEGLSLDLVV